MTSPTTTQLCFLPATELAARIRRRDLSPVEVTEAYLRRIEARNPVVNAYTLVLGDQAMDAARGRRKGGDGRQVRSGRCMACRSASRISTMSPACRPRWRRGRSRTGCRRPAPSAVERLLDAGAIVLGKTNTPEFGHKGITDNLRFGPTSTPWAIGYNSGGSSGGSAAAVADGMAALAQGTDGGGSVRIPASFSGTVGFKPSFGRIPSVTRPDGFLWGHPLVHIGPLARTVADAALMTAIMAGPHPPRSAQPAGRRRRLCRRRRRRRHGSCRVAYSPRLGNFPVDPRVAAVVASAVEALRASGIEIDEVELDFKADHKELARSGCARSRSTMRRSPSTGSRRASTCSAITPRC